MPAHDWTMSSGLLRAMLGFNKDHDSKSVVVSKSSVRPCKTVQDITEYLANTPGEQYCRLLWFDPNSLCAILNKFGWIFILGDSQTRQMMQGLHMIGSQDWADGSTPCGTGRDCHCDGQVGMSMSMSVTTCCLVKEYKLYWII